MRAVVLVSGGIDSTVALWWARRRGWEVIPLTFNYHERPKAERRALRAILRRASVSHLIEVPMDFLKEAKGLVKEGISRMTMNDAPEGYIPARNMIFYSIAAYYAEAVGAEIIVGGHNVSDPEEFPDSSRRFFRSMERLYGIGLWSYHRRRIEIALPLAGKSKTQVIRLGLQLGAPLLLTWSCHEDRTEPCGRCGSCKERDESFADVGLS